MALGAASTIMFGFQALVAGQNRTREIVSNDFTKNRKKEAPATSGSKQAQRRATPKAGKRYRLASSSAPKPWTKSSAERVEQLGITLWRLRPARTRDLGQRLPVRGEGSSSGWIPERIEVDTPLRRGDRVRLSMESPREGYLYIVDRDLYFAGRMGDAMLIYPTLDMRGGDNRVRAGKLIDIPAQEDNPNNFEASPVRTDQVGELLSIIVTTLPLDLPIGTEPLPISASQIAQWEKSWASETERFEMVGGAGQTWTKEEQAAAAGNSTRQLTRKEPPPQTIYRVTTSNKAAFMVEVQLKYAKQ